MKNTLESVLDPNPHLFNLIYLSAENLLQYTSSAFLRIHVFKIVYFLTKIVVKTNLQQPGDMRITL